MAKKKKVTKKKVTMPVFTEEQNNRIARAMNATWQTIGGDVLTAMQEGENRDYCTKDEFIEVVTDANYMDSYGHDPEACKWVDELYKADYDGAFKHLRKLFKFERFG